MNCYYAKYDGTDWEALDPQDALDTKEHYLSQCQSGPIQRPRGKSFNPIPRPMPEWLDRFGRTPLERAGTDEIQVEIDLDLERRGGDSRGSP